MIFFEKEINASPSGQTIACTVKNIIACLILVPTKLIEFT